MKKIKNYFNVALVSSLIIALSILSCKKDDDNNTGSSQAFNDGKASGVKYCGCLDTVSDPVFGAFTCLALIAVDGLQYLGTADSTAFANGFIEGSASCANEW